jgi:hypothetical protein
MRVLEPRFSPVQPTQKPPAMAFAGVDTNYLLRGLLEKNT